MNGIRPILDNPTSIGKYLKSAWYFDKWWEKLILIILNLLGLIKLVQLIVNF
jgi:hypothetical protein